MTRNPAHWVPILHDTPGLALDGPAWTNWNLCCRNRKLACICITVIRTGSFDARLIYDHVCLLNQFVSFAFQIPIEPQTKVYQAIIDFDLRWLKSQDFKSKCSIQAIGYLKGLRRLGTNLIWFVWLVVLRIRKQSRIYQLTYFAYCFYSPIFG